MIQKVIFKIKVSFTYMKAMKKGEMPKMCSSTYICICASTYTKTELVLLE